MLGATQPLPRHACRRNRALGIIGPEEKEGFSKSFPRRHRRAARPGARLPGKAVNKTTFLCAEQGRRARRPGHLYPGEPRRHIAGMAILKIARMGHPILRRNFEKPSARKKRERAEAVRRYRKLLRKRMEREGF